jgi:hydroxymethylpyrimidine/phosphomethylpyrimidine kinase
MVKHEVKKAAVLVIAGHDPSGAAGIHADIESIQACGANSATLVTATTTQDTSHFAGLHPQSAEDFVAQAQLLCADQRFSACKIGLLGDVQIAGIVANLLPQLGNIPIVLDPILRTGSGATVAGEALEKVMGNELVALSSIMTPNAAEARQLAGAISIEDAANELLHRGAQAILVTGADEGTPTVINTLWRPGAEPVRFEYPRLAGTFHGSGCTLSASLAAFLAQGHDIPESARRAQDFTWLALSLGWQWGRGQKHPDRVAAGRKMAVP